MDGRIDGSQQSQDAYNATYVAWLKDKSVTDMVYQVRLCILDREVEGSIPTFDFFFVMLSSATRPPYYTPLFSLSLLPLSATLWHTILACSKLTQPKHSPYSTLTIPDNPKH
jgi:hypothetical protein